jgi:hypothetical protein
VQDGKALSDTFRKSLRTFINKINKCDDDDNGDDDINSDDDGDDNILQLTNKRKLEVAAAGKYTSSS